jgi:hypothetical protein
MAEHTIQARLVMLSPSCCRHVVSPFAPSLVFFSWKGPHSVHHVTVYLPESLLPYGVVSVMAGQAPMEFILHPPSSHPMTGARPSLPAPTRQLLSLRQSNLALGHLNCRKGGVPICTAVASSSQKWGGWGWARRSAALLAGCCNAGSDMQRPARPAATP